MSRRDTAWIDSIKPVSGKQVIKFDPQQKGLSLLVSYAGTRSWRAVVHHQGKLHAFGLGKYPAISLKEARAQAATFVANPKLLLEAKQSKKQAKLEAQTARTFKEVAEQFVEEYVVAKKNLRSKGEIERILKRYVFRGPDGRRRWEHLMFVDITPDHVDKLLQNVVSDVRAGRYRKSSRLLATAGGERQADAVYAILSKMTQWYKLKNRTTYTSPMILSGMRESSYAERVRRRVLTDDEIRLFWKACDAVTYGGFAKLLLLTAQRRDKLTTMKWADLKDGVWEIDQVDREKGNAGALKLPEVALGIVNAQPKFAKNPYVFAGRHGRGHFNGHGPLKSAIEDKLSELVEEWKQTANPDAKVPFAERWTFHDLRRTARTLFSKLTKNSFLAERVLGHKLKGIEAVYNQYDYFEEKSEALAALASYIDRLVNPVENVVHLHERRR
ncbi:MAG: tyrosine-type recombinase/integrase [Parvibaculaceae bacterium]